MSTGQLRRREREIFDILYFKEKPTAIGARSAVTGGAAAYCTRWPTCNRVTLGVIGLALLALTGLTLRPVVAQTPVITQATPSELSPKNADSPPSDERATESASEAVSLLDRFRNVSLYENPEGAEPEMVDIEFAGRVNDETGPVADAVVLIREFVRFRGANNLYVSPPIVARTTTDQEGQYKVSKVPLARSQSATRTQWEILVVDQQGRLGLSAYKPNPHEFRRPFHAAPAHPLKAKIDINLQQTEVIGGTIIDPDKAGVAGVRVAVKEITINDSADSDQGPFTDNPFSSSPAQVHTYRFPSDKIHLLTSSSPDGTFELRLPAKCSTVLGLKREGYSPRLVRVSSSGYKKHSSETGMEFEFQSPAAIELRRLLKVSVTVQLPDGQAVESFQVRVKTPQKNVHSRRLRIIDGKQLHTTAEFLRESSDTQGRVELFVEFPLDLGLLPITTKVSADQLIAGQNLVLQAQVGRLARGRVVARDDNAAVSGVLVSWHSQKKHIEPSLLQKSADIQGKWEMVVPREAGYLSVTGQSPGLDFLTIDSFNSDPSASDRLTHRLAAGTQTRVTVPDFRVDRISDRLVQVVDESGQPIKGVNVSAKCFETLDSDGKTYRLHKTLAEGAITDASGHASLKLNRSKWRHGTAEANIFLHDEDLVGIYLFGRAEITPDSTSPIKLVVRQPWKVSGRVLIDGKPAKEIEVGLATRAPWQSRREWLSSGFHPIGADGRFEFDCEPGREYSVVLFRSAANGHKYYYAEQPITAVPLDRYDAGTIEITSDQLRTHQEMYNERQKASGATPVNR